MNRARSIAAGLALISAAFIPGAASAAEHEVQMRTKGETGLMVFEPAFLEIAPGDTVHFRATDPSHNAASIDGMIPAGAESWKGGLNKDVSVTFDAEGVHGIKCVPHYPMGMVALIVVGSPEPNLDAAKQVAHPGKAKKRMADLFAEMQ